MSGQHLFWINVTPNQREEALGGNRCQDKPTDSLDYVLFYSAHSVCLTAASKSVPMVTVTEAFTGTNK